MAIPKLKRENILDALKFIDQYGVPNQNMSTKYVLATENGKKYPPKYVVAVADHLANGTEISTSGFNSVEVKSCLESLDFTIETKPQEKYELTITADRVVSTDSRFTMDNLDLGNVYKPLDTYFKTANGKTVKRAYRKGERRISNQTMPRLACQIYEKQLVALSVEEKENFPTCRYTPDDEVIRGIYSNINDFREYHNSIEYSVYTYGNGRQFVIYCWNVFSTIVFVQECLKRFGAPGDQFVLIYREKEEIESAEEENKPDLQEEATSQARDYQNPFSSMLIESKNLIFRGAPGTGKSYLAKEIAADIISDGYFDDYTLLTDEQKQQVEFVQFHPSYDYSDFVEGLRPKVNDDGTMGFELQDGIFKRFVARARKNYEDSQKSRETAEKELAGQKAISSRTSAKQEKLKKYIFIIDEINRGEISKIFGELFFSIDPGYRGRAGEISTQYANLHADPDEKFYIPENVYIIGTMNDIDRSVDSFDFAMRRRFRFVELKADECLEMLASLEDEELEAEAIRRMSALNKEILNVEDLNENYQIGASYFLKLKTLDFDQLWTDYLQPLLQEYIRGMYDEQGIMSRFARAYGYQKPNRGDASEYTQDQG
jgi:hypothetical protein